MPDNERDRVHRNLVASLDDDEALEKMHEGWLPAEEWGPAIERVRARRFGNHALTEGNRLVGVLLGERFLASPEGNLVRLSIESLPRQSFFERLVPMMGARLRQSIRFEWLPSASGGLLKVLGRRSTPAEVTLGFFQALTAVMSPPPAVAIEDLQDEVLTLRVA